MNHTGPKWNWRSGGDDPGCVVTKAPASATFDVSGPRRNSRYASRLQTRSALASVTGLLHS
jgi:hypothetical protein